MKIKFIFIFTLISTLAFSQQEASVWYFGNNAGIKFNSNGTVTALTDGQLDTSEGCASIADNNGDLLFYTDGMTVYNKNHQVILNGSGLMGNWSTTQSATIVQKPGSPNLFYIFTLAAYAGVDGFRYSIVDMNLDGGLGGVTTDKNIFIYSPSSEKLAIVKHANNTDFWVVTHGWNNNTFYSYLLTSSGLNPSAVLSNIGSVITGVTDNVWGYMKIAPDGSKLAVCNSTLNLELYDFNPGTGQVSNQRELFTAGGTYGVEFSPNSELLYASVTDPSPYKILQYDLTSANIAASAQAVYNSNQFIPTALQLGPDNKIYIGEAFKSKLSVIENPNVIGLGCTLNLEAIDLAGRICQLGLPPFVTSFFYQPLLEFKNVCVDESVNFSINSNQTILSATWNFGDATPAVNGENQIHSYATQGVYTVSLSVTTSLGTTTSTRDITIFPKPILSNSIITLKQCDDNNDGFSAFNLKESENLFVANTTGLTFSYFETSPDAQDNVYPIINETAYTNQTVSNDMVFVRIENENGCFKVGQINLNVSTTLIPDSFQRIFTQCDDTASGSNIDGLATFNFSSVTAEIQALYPSGQLLDITYYKNQTDTLAEQNVITDASNYINIGYPNTQNIFVRVDSQINNECLGLGHHITLNVEKSPIVQNKIINQCDDNHDGIFGFNTTNLQEELLNGLTNVTVSYKDHLGNTLPSPLPNPFNTTSQIINVRVTNNTVNACFYDATIQLIVDDLPQVFPIASSLTTVCDDEIDPMLQDGSYSFDTATFQSTILGGQTGMIVNYYDQNNNLLATPLPNPFVTTSQSVRVEVINPINVTCKAIYTIPFVVKPVPKIKLEGDEIVCDELTINKVLSSEILDGTSISDYTYIWKKDGILLPSETAYTLNVNEEGVYTVDVLNSSNCTRTRTITVIASNIATISDVPIIDLSNNNSITVLVSGNGDYVYSLDNINFQESNVFENVPAGFYMVCVKDLNGCGVSTMEVRVLGIPNYFTPNGDGYHDYWNIKGISDTHTQIYIFNRFGKLIKEISPITQGWDGTYLGQPLPSNDYWYSIKLKDGRDIKGHFTLKR